MTRLDHFYRLLGVRSDVGVAELKSAYHKLAKRNHPDLFADAKRRIQQLKMMRINEAYMAITAQRLGEPAAAGPGDACRSAPNPRGEPARDEAQADPAHPPGGSAASTADDSGAAIGALRDPAYAYYKTGFRWWQRGLSELFNKNHGELRRFYLMRDKKSDGYVLRLAMRALHHFERAYSYFLVVVEQYPRSMWARDARWRLGRLENYSVVYQRICDNLSRRLTHVEVPRDTETSATRNPQ